MYQPWKKQKKGDAHSYVTIFSNGMVWTISSVARFFRPPAFVLAAILCFQLLYCSNLSAAEIKSNSPTHYNVSAYVVESKIQLSTNILTPLFSKYTGTNVSLQELVRAASDLQSQYELQGYTRMNIAIAPKRISHGVVTLDVFPGPSAQILVAGIRYVVFEDTVEIAGRSPIVEPARTTTALASSTKATKPGMKFTVQNYLVQGNSILPPNVLSKAITNIDGAFGTNVSFDAIRQVVTSLQDAYRVRGYVTVAVGLPRQKLTNDTVKVKVIEGRLASIDVSGNQYFSSNNVMRALPGLHTNMLLNSLIFQAELNRANANQDRQIYPVISPGTAPETSDLTLTVKDRLPLHAKLELNNQSTPGTPVLRLNSSAVYDNLWQQEHSVGVQYSFSPESYKRGPEWNFYDQPLVANYSAFYRLPLGEPNSIEDIVANNPGSFGYNEGTRKFNLPPPSGQADLTFYASRATIDTGLQTLSSSALTNYPGVESINQTTVQQDLTVNNDLGARLSAPSVAKGNFSSDFSASVDYKTYETTSYKTNEFLLAQTTVDAQGNPNPPVIHEFDTAVPTTIGSLDYLPLALHYNASLRDPHGLNTFGLGLGVNAWYSGSRSNLYSVVGSTKSSGHWVVLNPSYSRSFELFTNWTTVFRADGQWASEPLISVEQFGAGGVNSVRGYQEGQVFGDTGWHLSLEQQTPQHLVGYAGGAPLMIRGSVYMDYADTYLLDPQGRPGSTALWGVGFGGVVSAGSHWEARFLFSLPLLATTGTEAYDPFFNFSLTAQF